MWGRRIAQLKEAMKSILDQLKPEDSFNIIDFNSGVNVWNIQNSEVQYQEGGYYSFFNSPKIDRSVSNNDPKYVDLCIGKNVKYF